VAVVQVPFSTGPQGKNEVVHLWFLFIKPTIRHTLSLALTLPFANRCNYHPQLFGKLLQQ
jgi:hypothetical protein